MALSWLLCLLSAITYARAFPDCGISTVKQSRVIGGEDAKPGAWPWQVALYHFGVFKCGGTLISPHFVLTAAHCMSDENLSAFSVVVGEHDRSSTDGNEHKLQVYSATKHPGYNPYRRIYDVALIELMEPAIINDRVRPACMPKENQDPAPGTTCYLSGWGKTHHPGTQVNILQQTPLKIVDQKTCNDFNRRVTKVPVTKEMICAGYGPSSPRGGCHGDSGGPLVCQNKDGRWVLHGAVSWGSPRCDTKETYSVFSRVSSVMGWIEKNVDDLTNTTKPPPVCGGKVVASKAGVEITSPNHPWPYPPNSDCTWDIEMPSSLQSGKSYMSLLFLSVFLEEYQCKDYIKVYQDDNSKPTKLCGERSFSTFDAKKSLRVVFKSDERHQEVGFFARLFIR